MPFFPNSLFGLAYLAVLVVCTCVAWRGGVSRRLIAVMWAHWLSMRAIDSIDHLNAAAWVAHDIAMILAMLVVVRGNAAKAIAALFFVLLQFDLYSLVVHGLHMPLGAFETTASVGEAVGYISMLIMAGANYVDGGKLAGRGGRFGLGGLGGYWASHSSAPIRGAISSRTGSAGKGVASNPKTVP